MSSDRWRATRIVGHPCPPFTLVPATWTDFPTIHALRVAGLRQYVCEYWDWDEASQRERFRERFDPAQYQLILCDGETIGAVSVLWGDGEVFLADLEIAPAWRNRGLGTAIIADILAEARIRGLPVALQVLRNNPARRLYERHGFQVVAETASHLRMRHDAEVRP